MLKKIKTLIIILAVLIVAFVAYGLWCNKSLELNTYIIDSENLPEEFDGFRIAHISDFHNTEIGRENEKLLEKVSAAEPDIIAITGDLIDSRKTRIDVAAEFVKKLVKIAPCYYVTGNHEQRIESYEELKKAMVDEGIEVLENEKVRIKRNDAFVTIAGVDDPMFTMDPLTEEPYMVMEKVLDELLEYDDGYCILLSHRPELMDTYAQRSVELVLSGHAHGGQINIPFIGGLISPGEGFFPEFYAGIYRKLDTQMVVSKGIGNSLFPLRINNRPEVGLLVLKR